ncbi:hypothetical protein BD311DRAFT_782879 [Dichomitus squalens]|uniref:Uncharacterized protein n=1 Tax=Dichomitus squalens TaxID=114155 RepID=A0A4Q9M5C7_9APHY|nr:hypothetical protein BD311DRAFT_783026 [Dichomitus squalens]TBU21506.1 hypothetical protein BD311DRAFT_782879 [Dichomitus squalens]
MTIMRIRKQRIDEGDSNWGRLLWLSLWQVAIAHPSFMPPEEMYHDFPSGGCPIPGCTDNCDLFRFPKQRPEHTGVLAPYGQAAEEVRHRYGGRARAREMCNWIECRRCFSDDAAGTAAFALNGSTGEGSVTGSEASKERGEPDNEPAKRYRDTPATTAVRVVDAVERKQGRKRVSAMTTSAIIQAGLPVQNNEEFAKIWSMIHMFANPSERIDIP